MEDGYKRRLVVGRKVCGSVYTLVPGEKKRR